MKWVSKFVKKLLIRLGIFGVLCFLLFSFTPIVAPKGSVSPEQVRNAKEVVKKVWQQLSSSQSQTQFELAQEELNDLSAIAGHTLKGSNFNINVSSFGVNVAASIRIPLLFKEFYINGYCLYGEGFDGFAIEKCQLGKIPVPGFIAQATINTGLWLLFGDEVEQSVATLIASAKPSDNSISFNASKSIDFKKELKSSLSQASQIVGMVYSGNTVEPELVQSYIDHLLTQPQREKSLGYYVGEAFAKAQLSSLDGADPVEQNRAAIWALAIVYGSGRFSELSDVSVSTLNVTPAQTALNGRGDLSLHFLYSVILEQVGKENIGLSIGELKELLDSNKGGSGYSFADLAADKAGIAFSSFVTENEASAIRAQNILAGQQNEQLFLPFTHDLPEGFRGNQFNAIIGHVGSDVYQQLETSINKRISTLPLYKDARDLSVAVSEKRHKPPHMANGEFTNGQWLVIDTHMHTRYSDGDRTVTQLAEKASEFGCDAIAITDHGDYNLKKVTSPEYFSDIAQVDAQFSNLTVIPGFEWNVPPFMGREHATVLLPKSPNMARNLNAFKERFDSYGKRTKQQLTNLSAAQWLNKHGSYGDIKPVVIYNHPNRKDFSQGENTHDLATWMDSSDSFIGFSGAPGHQKMRDGNNGSYTYTQKTVHRWDPAVLPGNSWDQLLQRGYNVWGARAGSDFHGTSGDYWPCQFSTTHLYSRSNSHNDVLSAIRNGNMWAQHGRFIDELSFYVNTKDSVVTMGESAAIGSNEIVEINAHISLNPNDWQGYPTSLDALELIIIEKDNVQVVPFEPILIQTESSNQSNKFHLQHSYKPLTTSVVFRLRGRSIQPEMHHYMFYSNPIRLIQPN